MSKLSRFESTVDHLARFSPLQPVGKRCVVQAFHEHEPTATVEAAIGFSAHHLRPPWQLSDFFCTSFQLIYIDLCLTWDWICLCYDYFLHSWPPRQVDWSLWEAQRISLILFCGSRELSMVFVGCISWCLYKCIWTWLNIVYLSKFVKYDVAKKRNQQHVCCILLESMDEWSLLLNEGAGGCTMFVLPSRIFLRRLKLEHANFQVQKEHNFI